MYSRASSECNAFFYRYTHNVYERQNVRCKLCRNLKWLEVSTNIGVSNDHPTQRGMHRCVGQTGYRGRCLSSPGQMPVEGRKMHLWFRGFCGNGLRHFRHVLENLCGTGDRG